MTRHCILALLATVLFAAGNLPRAEAQIEVTFTTGRSNVAIDLNSVVVLVPPEAGTLSDTSAGIVYTPDGTTDDSFAFVADHAFLDAAVTFVGEVFNGAVHLSYEYTATKDEGDLPNGTENPDGTITVVDGTTTVTGTIIQEPGTTIDFPEGTVVIGTDNSVDNDVAIIDSGEGSEIHTHDNITSLEELAAILETYEDNSIPALVIVGHGTLGGGVSLNDPNENIDGATLGDGAHQDLIDLINEKLEEDAQIFVLGCDQFSEGTAAGIQELADATGHEVVANEDPVSFTNNPLWWDWFTGTGHWVEVTPTEDPADTPACPPTCPPVSCPPI